MSSTSSNVSERARPSARLGLSVAVLFGLIGVFAWMEFGKAGFAGPANVSAGVSEPSFDDVSSFAQEDVTKIDHWLDEQAEKLKYPSLAVAVVRDREVVYSRAIGYADVAARLPATLRTQYDVASVTKVFTATLAVLLDEQGVVGLDDPVVKYLPSGVLISRTPELGATITLRQLASHTSGLPRGVPGRVQIAEDWYALQPRRLYDHLSRIELDSNPGTNERYSNLGFGLLGHALERAAGEPLDQLLTRLICEPLELRQTTIPFDASVRAATGYDEGGTDRAITHSRAERLAGSGGLVTSAEDLCKFLSAHFDTRIFSSATLDQLQTPTRFPGGTTADTSLGWSIRIRPFVGRYMKKNGGRQNASAWIGYSPGDKLGVVVVTNCGGPDVDPIGNALLIRAISNAYRPVHREGFAKVAPFDAVRWEDQRPVIRVQDDWYPLQTIDEIPVDRIIEFTKTTYGEKSHKRFTEDLVEVMAAMGHKLDWEVRLGLRQPDGRLFQKNVRMTTENRYSARQFAREAN